MKIQRFDAFGEDDWVDTWTDNLIILYNNRKESNDRNNHPTKIKRTYNDGFDLIYFMMMDSMGHTEWFRMDETEFLRQWLNLP